MMAFLFHFWTTSASFKVFPAALDSLKQNQLACALYVETGLMEDTAPPLRVQV